MTKTQSRRNYWKAEYEVNWQIAMAALKRFKDATLLNRDWGDWQEYKTRMKAANKASGIMMRCKH